MRNNHGKAVKEQLTAVFRIMLKEKGSISQLQTEILQIYSAKQYEPMTIFYDWRFLEASSLNGLLKRAMQF